MNILQEFLEAGAPATPAYPLPAWADGMSQDTDIVNAWRGLNDRFNEMNNFVTDLTAKLSALETSVSDGSFAAFAALRLNQVTNGVDREKIILQLAAAFSIGTAGPALLSAATACWLTPIQAALTNFNSTYYATLHAKGLI